MVALKFKFLLPTLGVAILALLLYFILVQDEIIQPKKPHIIIVIADDVGRNDVGFYGSAQIPTPNIDALAYNGIILDKFYTQSACTPSRAALLTGNYPLRYGLHIVPIQAGENRSLAHTAQTMPQHLRNLGYKTHLIGKWHLGATNRDSTPTKRGFDTHYGYWHGFMGYFDYQSFYSLPNGTNIYKGLDFHDNFKPEWSTQGKYATQVFTDKALEVIEAHNHEEPIFLVLAHLAAHTGENGTLLGVPDETSTNRKFAYIKDPLRRSYADVVYNLDKSVGEVIQKLSEKRMLENSIILFFSDNGAPTYGTFANAGSNWPLRGIKMTEFEGAIRPPAAIFSPLFHKKGYVNQQLMHLVDFLPTFYAAAGGNLTNLGKIDGVNQWEAISKNLETNRSEIIVNINELDNSSAIIGNRGKYKYIKTGPNLSDFVGESGRASDDPPYDYNLTINSAANKAIQKISNTNLKQLQITKIRTQTDLSWCRKYDVIFPINCQEGCLFNLEQDPCETTNIIHQNTDIKERLIQKLKEMESHLVPQSNLVLDPKSNPKYYNNTWCTWLDDELCYKTPQK